MFFFHPEQEQRVFFKCGGVVSESLGTSKSKDPLQALPSKSTLQDACRALSACAA